MRVLKKMSFEALMGNVSREEMKSALAGSGEVLNGSGYTQSQGGGGSGYNGFANAMAIAFQPVASFYTGLQALNQPGSAMYVPQQSYNSSNGWGNVAAAINNYNYTNNYNYSSSYSSSSSSSGSNEVGWSTTSNGSIKTTDPTAIGRMMALVDLNILNNRSPGYGLEDFAQNETSAAGRAANDAMYGAIQLNNVTVYNNYRKPQGMNYQNGSLYLDMGLMMGSGGVMIGSNGVITGSGGYQVQTISIKSNGGPTDCVFQCMAQIGALYGRTTSFSFADMKANYDSIYKTSTAPGSVAPAAMGVNEILLSNFVDQYFNRAPITTTSQLDTFITAGGDNFAIGVIRKYSADGASSTLHAVVLTKMEGNGYRYTDPQKVGIEGTVNKNDLVNLAAITGICN